MGMKSVERIKRFLDCYIPTETCNLRCHYCYVTQQRLFNNKLAQFNVSTEKIKNLFSKERFGGTCLINLCAGGETLLSEEVLPLARSLIEVGHYVMIVTNGTISKRFQEVVNWPDEVRRKLFFKFSFHYLEMVRLNMLDRFWQNVNTVKDNKISFTVEVTPSDELIPYIDKLKENCLENIGSLCHITIARDDKTKEINILSNYTKEQNRMIWSAFKSELYDFKYQIFNQPQTKFCYAGDWSVYINLGTGDITQCYCGKIIGNIFDADKLIEFRPVGTNCTLPHCYNGHAFLALGDIPEISTPSYAQLRNRVCSDGSEWLQPEMKSFMSTKLFESNEEYSKKKKRQINKAGEEPIPFSVKVKSVVYKSLPESIAEKIANRKRF